MATRSITRLASAAVVTGIAALALAGPASAEYARDGGASGGTGYTQQGPVITTPDSGWELNQVATGLIAGAVLAGAGVAGAAGLRRHQQLAHPA